MLLPGGAMQASPEMILRLKWNTEPSLGIRFRAFIVKNDVLHGVTVATDPLGF
jgi:hypothetical protein